VNKKATASQLNNLSNPPKTDEQSGFQVLFIPIIYHLPSY